MQNFKKATKTIDNAIWNGINWLAQTVNLMPNCPSKYSPISSRYNMKGYINNE